MIQPSATCRRCGAALNPSETQGLCPVCLLETSLGLDEAPDGAEPVDTGWLERNQLADAPPPDKQPHHLGDYELLEEIGRGGMGIIYRARQLSLDRFVAVKTILTGPLASPDFVQRFQTEAHAAAVLDHPNIVPIFDVGDHQGQPYYSMRLVSGRNLAQELKETGAMSSRRAAELVVTVARAVHYAHQRGVLHRDLKPANILLDADGTPHVTDFGLAKLLEQDDGLTLTQAALGTPNYMAPEQAAGDASKLTTAADVYSLGAILFELLTGRKLFTANTPLATINQAREQEPPRPSTILRTIPRDLDTICWKCLEKEPQRRYPSAQAVADDLERWLKGEPIRARRVGMVERVGLWCRRKPAMARLAGAASAAVLIVSGIDAWRLMVARGQKQLEQYAAAMNLVQQAWEQNNVVRMRQLLDEAATFPGRGFEWFYWQGQAHQELMTLSGQRDVVSSVTFSPDGQRIVTSENGRVDPVRVWDATSGKEILTVSNGGDAAGMARFSPDGRSILTCGWNANLCDAATGKLRQSFPGGGDGLIPGALSPDGRRVAIGGGGNKVRILDVGSSKELLVSRKHTDYVVSVDFSPDGEWVVSGSRDGTVKVWDAATGEELHTFQHGSWMTSAAFSPDGKQVVTCSDDQAARVWNVATGTEVLPPLRGHSGRIWHARFSPDGRRIVTGSADRSAKVWDAATHELLFTLKGHGGPVRYVSFSPDGQKVATASLDATAKIWAAVDREDRHTLKGHTNAVISVSLSLDGRRMITGSQDHTAKVWDALSGRELMTLQGHTNWVRSASFSPDGLRIVTASEDGTARVWDAASGNELLTTTGHITRVWSAAFSPDGLRIVTGSDDPSAKLWDAATGKCLRTFEGHTNWVRSVGFSPDGRRIITTSFDGTARVWDVASGKELLTLKANDFGVNSAAFSPDGRRIATGSSDRTARVWDAVSGRHLFTLAGHGDHVSSVAFSSDGQRIITCCSDGAKLWDVATGRQLLTIGGHEDTVTSVALSPDRTRLFIGGSGGTIRVLEAARAEQVAAWAQEERAAAQSLVTVQRERQRSNSHQ